MPAPANVKTYLVLAVVGVALKMYSAKQKAMPGKEAAKIKYNEI